MNRAAETIKEQLTMREVVEHYGFTPNRAGYIRCPFHVGDHQASLRIYPGKGGFCCFGCGAKGSVIDFVMRLFDCSFGDAVQRINDDFSLCIDVGRKLTYRERKSRQGAILAVRERNNQIVQSSEQCEKLLSLYILADTFIRLYNPSILGRVIPGYCWAAKNIAAIKYDLLSAEEKRWNLEQTPRNTGMEKGKLPDTRTV